MDPNKLLPPHLPAVLEREQLLAKLDGWSDKKLVIIHAEAGQGKTTLAAEYTRTLKRPSIWYTLDAEDENPSLFLAGLGEALRRAFPGRIAELPSLPQTRHVFGGLEHAVERWMRQVFGCIGGSCLVVLDDFNVPTATPEFKAAIAALLAATPPHIRLLLLSRSQPEIDVTRLRARQAMAELSGRDLRFSTSEVRELFTVVFGASVTDAEAERINRTAEGWPAGLVLMREYIAAAPSQEFLVGQEWRHGSECRERVFDYLAQEVFHHLPEGLREFLLRTSVADSLNVRLMELLTGLPERAPLPLPSLLTMVSELRRRNLFIVSGADASRFRYHSLFRAFLRKTLKERFSATAAMKLYRAAADHYIAAGDIPTAVNLLIASEQFVPAVAAIEEHAPVLILRGLTQTVTRWGESLPAAYARRPWFPFARAVANRFTDPRAALDHFELALSGFRADRRCRSRVHGQMLALAGIIEACFYAGGHFRRMAAAAAAAKRLLGQHPSGSTAIRARLHLALGIAGFFTGNLRQGADDLLASLGLFRRSGDAFSLVTSAMYLAPCALYLGDFRQAREAVAQGFDALAKAPEDCGGEAALTMARAMTALFEGKFDEAHEYIESCERLAREHGLDAFHFLSLDIGGWLRTALGEFAKAEALLFACRQKGEIQENPFFTASASHLLAVNYLHQGRLRDALAEAEIALAIRSRAGSRLFHALSLTVLGAIHLRGGKFALAERHLHHALAVFRRIGAAHQQATSHLLLALLLKRTGPNTHSDAHLAEGFRIAQERQYVYFPPLRPRELSELAADAVQREICAGYCRMVTERALPGSETSVRVFCLGRFQVVQNGELIRDGQWKSRPARTLLKLLAGHEGQQMTRDALSDILWPDVPADRHGALFSVLLHRLRKRLGSEGSNGAGKSHILVNGIMVSLNTRSVWTDVSAFRSEIAKARNARAHNKHVEALLSYERAIELYDGDFLPGDVYEEWTIPIREELRRLYSNALDDAAEITETLGEQGRSAVLHEQLFEADQCNEKSCRWLMAHHLAAGRRNDAIRVFERCQLALRRELDIDPEDRTRRLFRTIVGGA